MEQGLNIIVELNEMVTAASEGGMTPYSKTGTLTGG